MSPMTTKAERERERAERNIRIQHDDLFCKPGLACYVYVYMPYACRSMEVELAPPPPPPPWYLAGVIPRPPPLSECADTRISLEGTIRG